MKTQEHEVKSRPNQIWKEAEEVANIHFVHVLYEERTKNYFFVLPHKKPILVERINSVEEIGLDELVSIVEEIIHRNSLV